jgi:hypothetical protein
VNAGVTAQQAYRLMLREHIAPALRALGFRRGPSPGAPVRKRHSRGGGGFIKSRGSTRQEAGFWVDLHASDITTEFVYWDRPLASLDPQRLSWWTVRASGPVEPVAGEVLWVFRSYGWPAIQAALDSPG